MLADISREYRAIEGGYQFERWLSLFMNMPVVGGENGMADNLAKATNNDTIYTSAKMYANVCGVSQALKNFKEQFKDKKDPVYYFVVEKKGEKFGPASSYTSISNLNCYLVKIFPDNEAKPLPYSGQLIGPNGKPTTPPYPLKMKDKTQVMLMPCASQEDTLSEEYAFFSIPTLPEGIEPTDAEIMTTADYLSGQIQKSSAEISKKIMTAYQSLQKVEQDTDNYRSIKGQGKGTIGTSSDYIEAISRNYNQYKLLMNQIFAGEKEDKKIKESLDNLIETIIKEKLLK